MKSAYKFYVRLARSYFKIYRPLKRSTSKCFDYLLSTTLDELKQLFAQCTPFLIDVILYNYKLFNLTNISYVT